MDTSAEETGGRRWIGLVAVLAVAVACAVVAGIGMMKDAKPSPFELGEDGVRYRCGSCGHEFVVSVETLRQQSREMGPAGPGTRGFAVLDCPDCGAKKGARRMVKCPACGKHYVPPDPGAGKDICPHCKTDRIQWYQDRDEGR